jgi:hypothetical protein
MSHRYVSFCNHSDNPNRCGKLSVLRFVTLTLGDGKMVRCYRHDQEDGGTAYTFQPCATETFKSSSGTEYRCGYGLYVVDNDNDSFFSIESRSDVLHEVFDSFRQDGIPIKHATVCDEIIPCNSRGNLVNKKLYTLSASFEVNGDYQLGLVR